MAAALAGPVAIGLLANSLLLGIGLFAVAVFLVMRAEEFLATETGRIVESIFNWSLGMSFAAVIAFAMFFYPPGLGLIALLSIAATIAAAAIQIADHRRRAAARRAAIGTWLIRSAKNPSG